MGSESGHDATTLLLEGSRPTVVVAHHFYGDGFAATDQRGIEGLEDGAATISWRQEPA